MGFVNIYSEMIPYLAKHFEYLNQLLKSGIVIASRGRKNQLKYLIKKISSQIIPDYFRDNLAQMRMLKICF